MAKKTAMLICEVCNQLYTCVGYRARTSRYCSKTCWSNRRKPILKQCPQCGSTFDAPTKTKIYCSHACKTKHMVGVNAAAYKDGKSAERQRGRDSTELTEWRKAVYIRDKATCQQCGYRGKNIHAHHIKSYAMHPDLRFDVSNGITVCVPCHEKIHGRKLSTPSKYPKKCIDCGCDIAGRSYRCHSCASKHAHITAGRGLEKTCPVCKKSFKAVARIHCSSECASAARFTSQTVECMHCGKPIQRQLSLLKRSKSGGAFCSETCQHAHQNTRIETTCPYCAKQFTVKAYRVKDGNQPACSKACGYALMKAKRQRAPG